MLNEIKELKIHEFKEKLKNQENNKELIIPCQAFNLFFLLNMNLQKTLFQNFLLMIFSSKKCLILHLIIQKIKTFENLKKGQ